MAEELLTLTVATPVGLELETDCESVAAPSVAIRLVRTSQQKPIQVWPCWWTPPPWRRS